MASGFGGKYVFEIPVYFYSEADHVVRRNQAKHRYLESFEAHRQDDPAFYDAQADTFDEKRWHPWAFNHIVGWVGLYCFGNQIRGELHFADMRQFHPRPPAPRLSRDNRKPIIECGKLFETEEFTRRSSAEIYELLLNELERVARDHRLLKNRYVDLGPFKLLGPHVNWRAVLYNEAA